MTERRLILFDVDGTLVDSAAMIEACIAATWRDLGLERLPRRTALSIVGLSLDEAMATLLGASASPALLATASQHYKGHFVRLRQEAVIPEPLFPGAAALLDRLSSRADVVLGLVTGKSRGGAAHVLQRFGWRDRFATIQTADDAPSKPHPAMVLQAARATGFDPKDAVVVGDTTFDMAMARGAGARAVGVAWGNHAVDALRAAGASHVLDHFDDFEAQVP